jgi:hypothetical protein
MVIGQGPRWLILLTGVEPVSGGMWVYTYSFAPGRLARITVQPHPGMLPPYDATYAELIAGIAGRWPAAA